MNQEKKTVGMARRELLKLAGLGGVAGVAAVAVAPAQADAAEAPSKNGAGYRETAHVRTYYELAKF